MGIKLKEHNQQAYSKVNEKLEKSNKVAVVHPTGTGKSYIALKLIEENEGKKVIYLAPSRSILHKIKEEMIQNGVKFNDGNGKTVERYTYQKITKLNSENRLKIKADIIVLDEFHHCGAPEWGKAVKELLAQNPDAKILGLSATPMRYFDEEIRDMAEELFEESVASEMTLAEAIKEGILREPIYVTGIYESEKIIKEEEEIIDKAPEGEKKELAKKELEKLRVALDNSVKGLPELLEKNMTNKSGKYMVYCKDIADMEKKMEQAQEIFGRVNTQIEIMGVSSEKSEVENNRQIRKFEKDKNANSLKLLFSVDMLNEGYHLKDLDGVIMMRPTYSPTLYDQQLGRALSVGMEKQPLVIDLVNNIDTIDIIENFSRQLEGNGTKKRSNQVRKFAISEETRNIRNIIKKIDSLIERKKVLTAEERLELMQEYMRETGKKIIYNTVYKGYKIGQMRDNMQTQYRQGTLKMEEELLKRFKESGIIEEGRRQNKSLTNEEKLELMQEYMRETGKKIIRTTKYKGYNIGQMRNTLQAQYRQGTLKMEEDLLKKFIESGIIETEQKRNKALTYQEKLELMQEYMRETGEKITNFTEYKGYNIGQMRNGMQVQYRQGTLKMEEDLLKKFIESGIIEKESRINAALTYKQKLELMQEYMKETGKKIIKDTKYKGYNIGQMKNGMQVQYRQGTLKMDEGLLSQFIESGIIETERRKNKYLTYKEKLKLMQEYMRETGKKIIISTEYKEYKIGQMRNNLQRQYRQGTLKMEEGLLNEFIESGIIETERKVNKHLTNEEKLELMQEYMRETGKKIVRTTEYKGYKIGKMQKNMQFQYRQGTLKMEEGLLSQFIESGIIAIEEVNQKNSSQAKEQILESIQQHQGELQSLQEELAKYEPEKEDEGIESGVNAGKNTESKTNLNQSTGSKTNLKQNAGNGSNLGKSAGSGTNLDDDSGNKPNLDDDSEGTMPIGVDR